MLFSARPRRLPLVTGVCAGVIGAGAAGVVLALIERMVH